MEYGENFSKLCKKKFREYKNISVITEKFDNVSFPEEIGYTKVYAMLKPGGAFARFANHPYRDKGNPILSTEIDKLYSKYYYAYYGKDIKKETEYSEEQAIHRAKLAACKKAVKH